MTHVFRAKIIDAFSSMSSVTRVYDDPRMVIEDVGKVLKLKRGRILALRLDLLGSASPKFLVFKAILESDEVQTLLRARPKDALFDGVGFEGFNALVFYARKLRRKLVVVVAKEFPIHLTAKHDDIEVEIIWADEPGELGYVKKLRETCRKRKGLIYLAQARRAPKALASVGKRVVQYLKAHGIRPDATAGVMASGGCMYGIQKVVGEKCFGTETLLVERAESSTFDPDLDLRDKEAVKTFARKKLQGYRKGSPPQTLSLSSKNLRFFPLHVEFPNREWLEYLALTGTVPFDRVVKVSENAALRVLRQLRKGGLDFGPTTAMTLVAAIKEAETGKGKVVLIVVYGKDHAIT